MPDARLNSIEHIGAIRADLQDPLLLRLYDYWSDKCGERAMPARTDIDPHELRFIIGHLALVDVMREPLRFRFRLHGTHLVERAGYELTGKMLDALPISDFRALTERTYSTVVATAKPFHALRDRLLDNRPRRYEVLVLPLGRDGCAVDMLLLSVRYKH